MDISVSVEENHSDGSAGAWRKRSRRRWSERERREIVLASLASGVSIARVARDYGVNANLLWNWRRKFRQTGAALSVTPACAPVAFVPIAAVVDAAAAPSRSDGAMELTLPGGARIRVDTTVDQQALIRVLCAFQAVSC